MTEQGELTVDITFKRAGGRIYQDASTQVRNLMIDVDIDVFPLLEYSVLGTSCVAIAMFAALAIIKRKELAAKFPF